MSKIRDLIQWNRPSFIPVSRDMNFSRSFTALQEEMNRLFDHFSNGAQAYLTDWEAKTPTMPAVNVIENGDSFKVEAELAGIDPKKVNVEMVGGYLTISGEREEEKEEKKETKEGRYLRREMSFGSFVRTVDLPETADVDKAVASFRNGILTIAVPKKAAAVQPAKKIDVKIAA